MDAGYWTPQCEAWFQAHHEKILNGSAKPLSATEWRSNLKNKIGMTHKIRKRFTALAIKSLSSVH